MKYVLICMLFLSLPAMALDIPQGVIISTGNTVKTNSSTAVPFSIPSDKPIRVQCNADTWVSVYATEVPTVGLGVSIYLPQYAVYTTVTITGTRNIAIKPVNGDATCTVFWANGTVYSAISGGTNTTSTVVSPTSTSINEAILGENISANSIILTEANPTKSGIVLNYSRIYGSMVGANDWIVFDPNKGWWFGQPIFACTNCPTHTDSLVSSTPNIPIRIDATKGLKITCKTSIDVCDSTLGEGTEQTLCATATSRTRRCLCTANSSSTPTWAWALEGGAGSVGDSTTCPEVTP